MDGRAPSAARSALVLGIDSATWSLMTPWIEAGELPALGQLVRDGSSAPLLSTIPPVTPPAWTTFFTGKNPGKHRIFDFVAPRPNSYALRYLQGGLRQGESLWGIASRHGLRVNVVNVPMTYPPEPVNGCLVSGLDAPDESSRFTHPAGLHRELCDAVGGYRIDIRHLGNMRTDRRREATVRALIDLERTRGDACLHLLRSHPADLNVFVFNATDQVQHHFWHYLDPGHPHHDPRGRERFGDAILRVYRAVDREVGRLVDAAGPDTPVMVLSDHGAGPAGGHAFHINEHLAACGLLRFREGAAPGLASRAVRAVDAAVRSTLPSGAKSWLAARLPALRSRFEAMGSSPIDWAGTRAFLFEAYLSSPAVWIHRKDRFPEGTVDPADYDRVCEEVRGALLEARDPATGRPLLSRVYRRDEIYSGPYLEEAPDLVLPWWEAEFVPRPSDPAAAGRRPAVRPDAAKLRGGLDFVADHRIDGALVLAGGPFRRGAAVRDPSLQDITPTLLHLLGLPVPREMDGRVLLEAFEEGFLREAPVRYEEDEGAERDTGEVYTEEEEEKVRERLKGLGYLE
jgi:predicted AlkP superfamily phosphohydrolase/phosphomutase